MKKFIKVFLISSLSFGTLWILFTSFYWHKHGYVSLFPDYLKVGIKAGFAFGFFVTIFMLVGNKIALLRMEVKQGDIDTKQKREINVNLTFENTFKKAKEALNFIGAKITEENKKQGFITAKTGMSWKSFGENIKLIFKEIAGNQTQVKINSRPTIGTTIVDYGKNLDNVERISNYLLDLSKDMKDTI